MADENETGSNLIWAIATIIIVAIIAGALYYSGFLSGNKKQNIDVEIKPAASTTRLAALVKKSAPEYSGALNIKPFLRDCVF